MSTQENTDFDHQRCSP